MYRSRYLLALLAVAGSVLSSCVKDTSIVISDVARRNLRTEVINAVTASNTFDTTTAVGEADEFGGFLGIGQTRGLIQPHTNSLRDTLEHMQILGRIRVSKKYRDMAPSADPDTIWNYWVIAYIPTREFPRGEYVSVYVAERVTDHVAVRKLSGALAPAKHTRPVAKWRHSRTAPWATCTDNMCCCEDSSCRTPLSAHVFLSNSP